MFTLSEAHKGLPRGAKEKILGVFNSINEAKVAVADHPAEPTQAYICALREEDNKVRLHIVLYLTKSDERVTYLWNQAVSPKKLKEVESEALDFVENMGFMMDNMNLAKFTEAQRNELLDSLPIYAGEEKPREEEPLLLTEEDVDDLLPIGSAPDGIEQPTAVASPATELWKTKPAGATFDEGKSLELMEAEFSRTGEPADSEWSALLSPPAKQAPPKETGRGEPSKLKAVLRLLSSL